MYQVSYYKCRAQHYYALARAAKNPKLKDAYEAVARDFSIKSVTADPKQVLQR